MAFDAGNVTVADDGTEQKSGLAGAYYDAIIAQESPLWPNPDVVPLDYTGLALDWHTNVTRQLIKFRKVYARQANALANGAFGLSGEAETATNNTVDVLKFAANDNVMYHYELSLVGKPKVGFATRHNLIVCGSFNRIAGSDVQNATTTVKHSDASPGSGTVAVGAAGTNLVVQATGPAGVPYRWRATLRIINAYFVG